VIIFGIRATIEKNSRILTCLQNRSKLVYIRLNYICGLIFVAKYQFGPFIFLSQFGPCFGKFYAIKYFPLVV